MENKDKFKIIPRYKSEFISKVVNLDLNDDKVGAVTTEFGSRFQYLAPLAKKLLYHCKDLKLCRVVIFRLCPLMLYGNW